jgi:hypothetical protein
MPPKAQPQDYWIDGLFDFSLGINSGIDPLLLLRNQAAFAINTTFRGTFATNRPAYNKLTLNYGGNTALQTTVETGLWQGGCFYNPDFGNPSLMAAISGKLIQFSISGSTVTVTDQSIPGDPNPATPVQAWLWQSENYIIWNDGISLPVFFDGNSSRRSFGPAHLLGEITMPFTAPPIGSTVLVTMALPYTGPFNVPVQIDNAFYQPVANSGASYEVALTNISDIPTNDIPTGSQVFSEPAVFGVVSGDFNYGGPFSAGTSLQLQLTLPYTQPIGTQFLLANSVWTVQSISTNSARVNIVNSSNVVGVAVSDGMILHLASSSAPNVLVGTTTQDFFVPARGSSVNVLLTAPYVGPPNQIVFIGNGQYTIVGVPSGASSTTLTLINLNDTFGTVHSPICSVPINMFSLPELPAGRMGAYGIGRNWMALTDGKQFVAGDIVGGSSGTKANNFRDAVLRVTENTYLVGGGYFTVPGSVGDIRAMVFASTLDKSLGQGPLQIFTPNIVFSCNAPVDRATWATITNPILTETLISNGAQGQNSTVPANNDIWYRSIDGFRSLVLAQRQFQQTGNTPISFEVSRILDLDDDTLLGYSSGIVFDNRLLMTATPTASPQGVFHQSLVALNFDPISSIASGEAPPIYDGMWTGLNVLQLITGLFSGQQRAFSFSFNVTLGKIELYEILKSPTNNFDNGSVPIVWTLESPVMFKNVKGKTVFDFCRLTDGEIHVDEVQGQVDFQVLYKPDQYPCFVPWFSWSVCSSGTQTGFQPRMGLGEPDANQCDPSTNRPFREAYSFQIKFIIQGRCRLLSAKFKAILLPDPLFAPQICSPVCAS